MLCPARERAELLLQEEDADMRRKRDAEKEREEK